MRTENKLRAWVRYDIQGRIVPSSLILQSFKPRNGEWREIDANLHATTSNGSSYVRPSDWLSLPNISSEEKFAGLYAIFNHDSNYVALKCSGNYTVDWGDGTIENVSSGTVAEHLFDYSDFVGTDCSRGYRQTIITVVPQSGYHLTSISLDETPLSVTLPKYSAEWLDVVVSGQYLTALRVAQYRANTNLLDMEQFKLLYNSITNFSEMFENCLSLRSAIFPYTELGTNFSKMFQGCNVITSVSLPTTIAGTNFSNMFSGCLALHSISLPYTGNGTDFSNMFSGCSFLQSVSLPHIEKGINFSLMFNGCSSLRSIALYDATVGKNFGNMFDSCYSLQSLSIGDIGEGTDFSAMFSSNYSLQSISLSDISLGTNLYDMFGACYSLSKVNVLGISTDVSFNGCRLSRTAIVNIFNNLETVSSATIDVGNNYGTSLLTLSDKAIATGKGWTILT